MIELSHEMGEIAIAGIIAAGIVWIGWLQGFFRWAPDPTWNSGIALHHVIVAFALYFAISFLVGPLYIELLKPLFRSPYSEIGYASWLNFLLSFSILAAMLIWWRCLPRNVRLGIWRSDNAKQPYRQDVKFSLYSWCIAFPVVLFVNQLLETLLYVITHIKQIPDQLAVRFVKMTAAYPAYFLLAIFSIAVIAPLVEEFLFRGLLQSFIRKHLGSRQAILITAICFSFFHFSPEQGLGNLSIVTSLFPLALILGFIYERQRSLLASIGLHALFNAMSILNLYFLGGIPCAH